jgi:hypothetical protein
MFDALTGSRSSVEVVADEGNMSAVRLVDLLAAQSRFA